MGKTGNILLLSLVMAACGPVPHFRLDRFACRPLARKTLARALAGPSWPTFMGNMQRTGARAGKAISAPKLRWKRYIGVPGYLNNPVIHDGLVVVGSSGSLWNGGDNRDGLYAFELRTGRPKWRYRTQHDVNGISAASGLLIAGTDAHWVFALDIRNGLYRWGYRAKGAVYGSPLILDDRVYVADAAGWVTALDLQNGWPLWSLSKSKGFRGAIASDGARLYVAGMDSVVQALDRSNGRTLWRFSLARSKALPYAVSLKGIYATPVVAQGMVFIAYVRDSYYNDPPLVALDQGSGKLRWKATWPGRDGAELSGNFRSTPVYHRGRLYFALSYSNRVFAVDARTGRVNWTRAVGLCMHRHWSSAALGGGLLYQPRFDGVVTALDRKGKLRWQYNLSRKARSPSYRMKNNRSMSKCFWKAFYSLHPIYGSATYHPSGLLLITSGEGYLFALGQK